MALDPNLPEPVFVETDPQVILADLIAKYEADSGKPLFPAQDEMLFVNLMAYRESLVRMAIQDAAKQNLVKYARAPMLDYLGELVGVYRLSAQYATTTLRFSLGIARTTDTLIPQGTRVSATDSLLFATSADATIKAGSTSVDCAATCTDAGIIGNGWQPANISTLLDEIGDGTFDVVVSNITTSTAGSDQEDDDHLKERIRLAPESFSNAGSRGAYRFHALSAHPDIIDVDVDTPTAGTVALTPLMKSGLPSQAILDLVLAICSDEKARPLTDTVTASTPTAKDYAITAELVIYTGQDQTLIQQQATVAAEAYRDDRAAGLGRDIIPVQITKILAVAGVYDVTLSSPAATVVGHNEWAHCTAITITIKGTNNG
ncbi:baseplate J/gp47 family protein [Citrobacter portucalensis]|uniref:baseplate assembly protein n=1 Tax=Citrobacter portucalensis TaxID=1639133 RepID=UPI00226B0DD6|nr:baseplate J/gp47 family protein [Citrobacter portucalensis]MCX9039372.1 baseplate J/gp47 family protein [Citrobacter portucalensis]